MRRVLPPGVALDGVLGDLAEEFEDRARNGRRRAEAWYWVAALGVASHYLWESVRLRGGGGMDGWTRDLRYAVRRVLRDRGFSAIIVTTMGVTIGANAAIFGAVRPVLAPQLPFPEADRIVRIWEQNSLRGWTRSSASWQDARDWAAATRTLESLAVYNVREGNLVIGHEAQRIRYTLTEPDFFRILGVPPLLGRALLPDEIDPSRDGVVILSHGIWTRAFGADPEILGRSVDLAGQSLEVVGVMAASFRYPATDVDAWKPWGMTPDQGGSRDSYWVAALARLAPGVSLDAAQREMTLIGERLEEAYPDTNEGFGPLLEPIGEVAVLGARQGVLLLWGAVALLLLVACANVATLLLARGEARAGEMAVRSSLGAGRASLVRQLLAESLLTAALGGAFGLALAVPATAGVQALMGARLSYGLTVSLDSLAMLYTAVVTGLAGVAFGLLPAIRLSDDGAGAARSARSAAGHRSARLTGALVAGQTAFAVIILVAAGLLARTLIGLRSVDVGYQVENALAFRVAPPQVGMDRPEAATLLEEIRSRLAAMPGVVSVGAVNRLPLAGNAWGAEWTDRSRLGEPSLRAFARAAQPTYLATLGVPILQGRGLLPTDNAASEPVAVISAAAARYWPNGTPVGSFLSLAPDEGAPWVRVVGVVGDVEATSLGAGPAPVVYTPFEQSVFGHFGDWGMDFVVRTADEPLSLAGAIRGAVREVDPTLPVFAVGTLEDGVQAQLQAPRALGLLMGVFAAVALFLATLGIYGTLAYGVARSRPEIGVRMALGARASAVVGRVLLRGLALAGSGLVVGLLLAAAGGRWVEAMLFGVEPLDATTFVIISAAILASAVLASWVPAWRASRIDPAEALRDE